MFQLLAILKSTENLLTASNPASSSLPIRQDQSNTDGHNADGVVVFDWPTRKKSATTTAKKGCFPKMSQTKKALDTIRFDGPDPRYQPNKLGACQNFFVRDEVRGSHLYGYGESARR